MKQHNLPPSKGLFLVTDQKSYLHVVSKMAGTELGKESPSS
jgi:hypothetical protein